MHVVLGVGAAHVQRLLGTRGAPHAEVLEKGLHAVQVRRLKTREGDVAHPDDRFAHCDLLTRGLFMGAS